MVSGIELIAPILHIEAQGVRRCIVKSSIYHSSICDEGMRLALCAFLRIFMRFRLLYQSRRISHST